MTTTEALHASLAGPATARPRRAALALAREQLFVAAGQVGSGAGNLAFALLMARLLEPGEFAHLAAFLALYLVVNVPASSLTAGSAITPELSQAARRRTLAAGLLAGAAILAAAVPLAPLTGLPPALVAVLAAAAPCAGLLALERGRLYGSARFGRGVASLVAEPAVRLTAGVALAVLLGPLGAAVGVVLAGYVALLVAASGRRRAHVEAGGGARPAGARRTPRGTGWVVLAFLLLALVQNQDVLFANALLPATEAGRFAVLSTLGGISAFATTTVPLVLLPRAARGERHALGAALLVAAALGGGAVLVVLAAPSELVGGVFGARYSSVGGVAPLYLVAMALLGVARVLVAARCAQGRSRSMVLVLAGAVAAQAGLIVDLGTDAHGVAVATLAATALLTTALGAATVVRLPVRPRRETAVRAAPSLAESPRRSSAIPLLVLMGIGLGLRLVVTRGIWVDEATSISQAQMPFGRMIENIRTTDVHPPLHHAVLWLTVRVFGDGQLAVRAPSIVAGVLLIPVLYLAGRDLYSRRAGLLAAAIGAVAPFAVWYSQEARMYALFMLFATLAVWAQVRAVRHGRKRDWAVYALSTAALVWTHYFSLLPIAVQQLGFVAAAWSRRRERARLWPLLGGWAAAIAAVAVCLVPLWPILHDQLAAYGGRSTSAFGSVPSQAGASVSQSGAQLSIYSAIANAVWALWGYHSDATMAQISALWPLGMLLALLMLGRGRSRVSLLLVGIAVVPAVVLFAVGFEKRDLFEVRYFAATVPALILLFARAATSWTASRAGRALIAVALVASLGGGLVDQQVNGTNPRRYDFEGALTRIQREMRPGDTLVYEPGFLLPVIHYYEPHVNARPLDAGLPKRPPAPVRRHGHRPAPPPRPHGRVFLLASFLDKPQYASGTGQALAKLEHGRRLVERFNRPQIKVWVFR